MRYEKERLRCRHGKFTLNVDPLNPDILLLGTHLSKFGIKQVDRQWAIDNVCDAHKLLEINLEGEKGRMKP
jgi:hypothetical protein